MTTRRTSEVAPDLAFPARVHSFPTRRSSDLNDHGGGSDGDADERVEGHRGGQAQGLAKHLVPLAAGVACEIGNVQRNGGPKADDAGKRGDKELEKTAERLKFRGRRKHGAETAGFAARPEKKNQADEEQEGRGDALRSEERRVGKECRSGWSPWRKEEKNRK